VILRPQARRAATAAAWKKSTLLRSSHVSATCVEPPVGSRRVIQKSALPPLPKPAAVSKSNIFS